MHSASATENRPQHPKLLHISMHAQRQVTSTSHVSTCIAITRKQVTGACAGRGLTSASAAVCRDPDQDLPPSPKEES